MGGWIRLMVMYCYEWDLWGDKEKLIPWQHVYNNDSSFISFGIKWKSSRRYKRESFSCTIFHQVCKCLYVILLVECILKMLYTCVLETDFEENCIVPSCFCLFLYFFRHSYTILFLFAPYPARELVSPKKTQASNKKMLSLTQTRQQLQAIFHCNRMFSAFCDI